MKKISKLLPIIFICLLYGCANDYTTETITYKVNEPLFMDAKTFRKSVNVLPAGQDIEKQGKICFFDGYLYISEPEKGIHVIDNRNPADPKNIAFIELIGNADLSIRNNQLYADSYVDLVWFDITTPAKPELKGRLENVFDKMLPNTNNQFGIDYDMSYNPQNANQKIVVGWKLVERTETIRVYHNRDDGMYEAGSVANNTNGATGSMSRFGLYKDYLYVVMNNQIGIFNVSGNEPVKAAETKYIGFNVETIFSYSQYLFMGTPTGLLIYSVASPTNPQFLSSIQHAFGCDPVVVENDIAYVTVRSGNFCGQNTNELIVVDVADKTKPKQIVAYAMKEPKGLGIDNNTLFLCDDGLKIFDAKDPQKLVANQLQHYKGMNGLDVIPFGNVLMMIAEDGLYQYDYANLANIKQLSKLSYKK